MLQCSGLNHLHLLGGRVAQEVAVFAAVVAVADLGSPSVDSLLPNDQMGYKCRSSVQLVF